MIALEEWRARGRLHTLNGFEVFVVDEGDASQPVLLLIHGFPTASWDWHPVWAALRARFRLVALDMPGFGFSDKPPGHQYRLHEQADTVEALVQALGLSEFHVLAHDYGDTVAQELLWRQNAGDGAGQWLSCCLLNGGLFPGVHRPLLIQKLLASPLGPLINRFVTRRSLERAMRNIFDPSRPPADEEIDAFWALITHNDGRDAFPRLIRYMHERVTFKARWLAALTEACVPLALINGSSDPISGAHLVTHFRQAVGEPHYLLELPSVGHYPQMEVPERVVEGLLEFIDSIQPTAE